MKVIGQSAYLHISHLPIITPSVRKTIDYSWNVAKSSYSAAEDANIIKISPVNTSFIYSPDWDTANDPRIFYAYVVNRSSGKVRFLDLRKKNIIYHHKWMFCPSDYSGFDVEESMNWSKYWRSHPAIASLAKRDPKWRSKIGNYDYWKKNVLDEIL
jgi:hypothetical protein